VCEGAPPSHSLTCLSGVAVAVAVAAAAAAAGNPYCGSRSPCIQGSVIVQPPPQASFLTLPHSAVCPVGASCELLRRHTIHKTTIIHNTQYIIRNTQCAVTFEPLVFRRVQQDADIEMTLAQDLPMLHFVASRFSNLAMALLTPSS
jgi:hypothetical protein